MMLRSSFPALLAFICLALGAAVAGALYRASDIIGGATALCVTILVATIVASSVKVASAWDRAVVLRLGRFHSLRGPGMFVIIPIVDTIPYWLDTRVITTSFKAEKTLTKDTVPVDVDAVLFWKVIDPQRAALAVADYAVALGWAAQTALRDVIGKTVLADMLEGRDRISDALQKVIDARTQPWGVQVISVEVRDVLIARSTRCSSAASPGSPRSRKTSHEIRTARTGTRSRPRLFCRDEAYRLRLVRRLVAQPRSLEAREATLSRIITGLDCCSFQWVKARRIELGRSSSECQRSTS